MFLSNRVRIGMALALVSALTWLILGRLVWPFSAIEGAILDARLTWFSPESAEMREPVLVLIDQQTIDQLDYESPIDRGFLAKLLTTIDKAGPAAIGLTMGLHRASDPKKDRALARVVSRLKSPFFAAAKGWGNDSLNPLESYSRKQFPRGVFSAVTPQVDSDGVVRRHMSEGKDGFLPLYWRLRGLEYSSAADELVLLSRTPAGWTGPFVRYQAHLVDQIKPSWFKNKVVLIGLDLPGQDRVPVAWSSWLGDETGSISLAQYHAQAWLNLENRLSVDTLGWYWVFPLLMLFSGTAVFIGASAWSPRRVFLLGLLTAFSWLALGRVLFQFGWVLDSFAPVMAVLTSLGLSLWVFNQDLLLNFSFVRRLRGFYMAPELLTRLKTRRDALHKVSELCELAVLDISWPTSVESDQVSHAQRVLERVCTLVADHGGLVVVAESNHVRAVFNAPVQLLHFRSRAVTCAVRCLALADQLPDLEPIEVLLALDEGQAGLSPLVKPGGYWVSGPILEQLRLLKEINVQLKHRLLTTAELEPDLRDPNWQWEPVRQSHDWVGPLNTVRLASAWFHQANAD